MPKKRMFWVLRAGLVGVGFGLPVIALGQLPFEVPPPMLPSNLPVNGSAAGVNMATQGDASWRPYEPDELPAGFVDGMVIEQGSDKAIIDWDEFHIQRQYVVRYDQPSSSSVALNRVHGARTEIHGALLANGRVYLVNSNGVFFGNGAQVNVSQLIASSLQIPEAAFNAGADINDAINDQLAYFDVAPGQTLTEDQIEALGLGNIDVDEGALIVAAEGGRIILVGPEVNNAGTLVTKQGQILLLGARDKAYLAHSDTDPDSAGRSYLAGVGRGGTVTNSGNILANQSNVTMVGRAINQNGRITATTSVDWNGSVRLVAQDGAVTTNTITTAVGKEDGLEALWGFASLEEQPSNASYLPLPTRFSDDAEPYQVNFGEGSITEVVAHGVKHDIAYDLAASASPAVTGELIDAVINQTSSRFSDKDPDGNTLEVGVLDDQILLRMLENVDLESYLAEGQLLNNVLFVTSQTEYQALLAQGDVDPVLLDTRAVEEIYASVAAQLDSSTLLGAFAASPQLRAVLVERLVDQANFATAVASQPQQLSEILVAAEEIYLRSGSRLAAKGGEVFLNAFEKPENLFPYLFSSEKQPGESDIQSGTRTYDIASQDNSLIVMEEGSEIDVSGYHVTGLPMSDNLLEFTVQTADVRNAPLQRGGVLVGKEVQVNLLNGDDIDILDLSPYLAAREETITERLTAAGTIDIRTPGSFMQETGSKLDVSGGSLAYEAGVLPSTKLVYEGRLVDISAADPNLRYDGIYGNEARDNSDRWAPTQWSLLPLFNTYYDAFASGQDAGVLQIQTGREARLDGELVATSYRGIFQRDPTNPLAATARRSGSQMARGGSLLIDVGAVQNSTQGIWIGNDDEAEDETDLVITPELLGASGAGRILLATNDSIKVAESSSVNLAPGTSLTLQGNTSVTVAGDIRAPGGEINLIARQDENADSPNGEDNRVTVEQTALIDVSGQWINDVLDTLSGNRLAGRFIHGGDINLEAGDSLVLESGSALLANGGAQLTTAGKLKVGRGGDISIGVDADSRERQDFIVDARLESFAAEEGGTLSFRVPSVFIGSADEVAAIRSNTGSSFNDGLVLEDNFFTGRGFTAYEFETELLVEGGAPVGSLADIYVAEGADIQLGSWQYNLLGDTANFSGFATGAALADFLSPIRFAESYYRPAVDISFTAGNAYVGAGDSFQVLGNIRTENGGDIRFVSDHSIYLNGEIYAPGGDVSFEITKALNVGDANFTDAITRQAIWLGESARVSTVSEAIYQPLFYAGINRTPVRYGTMADSGDISMLAARGHIVLQQGSLLDVSGASAQATLRSPFAGDYTSGAIYGRAGSINLTGTEGMVLDGDFMAHSATATGGGGSLFVSVDPRLRFDTNDVVFIEDNDVQGLSFDPATILITAERSLLLGDDNNFGDNVSNILRASSAGAPISASLSEAQIEDAGFDVVTLQTANYEQVPTTETNTPGQVIVEDGVDLAVGERLVLDTTTLRYRAPDVGPAAGVRFAAPNILLGSSSAATAQQVVGDLASGAGNILFEAMFSKAGRPAGQIVLQGNLGIDGVEQVTLRAGNAIAVRGYNADDDLDGLPAPGELRTWGDLNLEAAQIYPGSYQSYSFSVLDTVDGTITTANTGGARSDLYSLGGSLTFNAVNIDHGGVVQAPMGQINLNASGVVTARDGSLLSVAPGEETLGGFIEGRDSLYYSTTGINYTFEEFAESLVNIDAAEFDLQEGAVVDASGGGDALFYQFSPSAGGAIDVLDVNAVREAGGEADYFAIIPKASLSGSPYDSAIAAGSDDIPLGQTVYLSEGAGVPAGEYVVLPARYAMLEGAYLITPVAGGDPIFPGQVRQDTSGASIVAGYLGSYGTDTRPSDWQAFKVEDGEVAYLRSGYTTTTGNQWFAEQNAADGGSRRLGVDAGRLAVNVQNSVTLEGEMRFDAGQDTFTQVVYDDILVIGDGDDKVSDAQVESAALASFNQVLDLTTPFAYNLDSETYGYTLLETQGGNVIRRLTVINGQVVEDSRYGSANGGAFDYATVDGVLRPDVFSPVGNGVIERNLTVFRNVTIDGNGGSFDLAAPNITIVDTLSPAASTVEVLDRTLASIAAESILVGGLRQYDRETGRTVINTIADNTTVATGAEVETRNLLLVARDALTVQSGARLTATDEADVDGEVLALQGDGALLRIAAGDQARIVREGSTGATGSLLVEEGATLDASDGALLFDASRSTRVDGELLLDNASLNVSAARINLGDTGLATDPDAVEGFTLDQQQLAAYQLNELVLTSQSTIDLYGSFDFTGSSLVLQGAGLRRGSDVGTEAVNITSTESLTLTNYSVSVADTAFTTLAHNGSLSLTAPTLQLGEQGAAQTFTIAGFDAVTLNASDSVVARDLTLQVGAEGSATDLTINTPLVRAARAAELAVTATRNLVISGVEAAQQAVEQSLALAGKITMEAATVQVDDGVRFELPSGSLKLVATADSGADNFRIGNATFDLAGRHFDFGVADAYSDAGALSLETRSGDLALSAETVIDLSATEDASQNGGSLSLLAANGNIALNGASITAAGGTDDNAQGGSLTYAANRIDDFTGLNNALNTMAFDRRREFTASEGDIRLEAEGNVAARDITVTAEQGSIAVAGTMGYAAEKAGTIELFADGASLEDGAALIASSTAGDGGNVMLTGVVDGVTVADGALIDVTPGDTDARGGDIRIRAPLGSSVRLDGSFLLSAAGAIADNLGRLYMNVLTQLDINSSTLSAADVASALNQAEANRAAFDDSGLAVTDLAEYRGTVIDLELHSAGDLTINEFIDLDQIRSGDYVVPDDFNVWNTSGRTVTEGAIALRVAGDLVLNESFSEGFVSNINIEGLPLFDIALQQDSWSVALLAGADIDSNSFRTIAGDTGVGSLTVADYQSIRSGTGDLFLAAAGDLNLGRNSAIYTAGRANGAYAFNGDVFQANADLSDRTAFSSFYGSHGGDLALWVGGDFLGAGSDQFYSNWLHRYGDVSPEVTQKLATSWLVVPHFFEQGLATFGGGDINVAIGGDAINLSVSSPTEARFEGDESQLTNSTPLDQLHIFSSGDIDVAVAGDLSGGAVLIGDGTAKVKVGGDLLRSPQQIIGSTSYEGLGFIGAVMDGDLSLLVGGDALIETVFNPTVLVQSAIQGASYVFEFGGVDELRSYFFTYDDSSRFEVNSLAGDVRLLNSPHNIQSLYTAYDSASADSLVGLNFQQSIPGGSAPPDSTGTLTIFPTQVAATALGGNILIEDNLTLFPAVQADLDLLAYGSIHASNPLDTADVDGISILVSFIDPGLLPGVSNPAIYAKKGGALPDQLLDYLAVPDGARDGYGVRKDGSNVDDPNYTWDVDYMPATPLHADSEQTFTIATLTGDIGKDNDITQFNWFLPGETRIRAGGDIDSLSVDIYHGTADGSQFSTIEAGGDIRFNPIAIDGAPQFDNGRFNLHGNGNLWVASQGDISLGTSRGIRSLGNSYVFNLPTGDADITVLAGVPLEMDLDFFYDSGLPAGYVEALADYVTDTRFEVALAEAVSAVTGESYASELEARSAYRALASSEQLTIGVAALQQADAVVQKRFAYQVFFEELNSGGLESAGQLQPATPDSSTCAPGYARACNAINLFFPTGSFSEANIDMIASTIQTRFGGDLNLLVPGGAVDVGVASGTVNLGDRDGFDPEDNADKFGLLAFEQGRINIFTRDNVSVAESRIASLAGSRIMIYSQTGSIDAGRGARTAGNTAGYSILEDGTVVPPKAVSGSGIRVASAPGQRSESINLWAPAGVIDAGEAGISSDGAVFLGAQSVLNADQISAEGDSVGVADAGGAGDALSALSGITSAATAAASESLQAETSTSDDAEATLTVRLLKSSRIDSGS